jgi:outer membrane protein assembly factor BamD
MGFSKRVIWSSVIVYLLIGGCQWKEILRETEPTPAAQYKKGLAFYKRKQYARALEIFNELKANFPGEDPYYSWAELKAADCHFFKEEYEEAITNYEEFRKFHPFHEDIPYVIFQIGLAYFNQMKSADRDQSFTRKALSNFEFLIASYPPSIFSEKAREKVKICRKRLAEQELYIAKYHYKKKKYQGAKERLEVLVEIYPEVDILDEALVYLGKSHLQLGESEAARKVFTHLVQKYPESRYSNEAKERLSELPKEEFTSPGAEPTK